MKKYKTYIINLIIISNGLLLNLGQLVSATTANDNNPPRNLKIAIVKNSSLENCLYFKDIKKKTSHDETHAWSNL